LSESLRKRLQVQLGTSRNSKVLASFVAYCQQNPDTRFWQALRNWCGHNFIYVSEHQAQEFENPQDAMTIYDALEDTFYWTGRDG
jgi:hypothetical protein